MEKVHEKFIYNLDKGKKAEQNPFYDNFLENLASKYKFQWNQLNYVFFGLPKTGKTQIGKGISQQSNQIAEKNGTLSK